MNGTGPAALPVTGLVAFLSYHLLQRTIELALSRTNARRLLARGAREHGPGHFPALVVMHALFPVALVIEVVMLGARPGRFTWGWLALFAGAQLLRMASQRALGELWTARVIVLEGAPRVRSGVYRWLKHPNYLAVAIELLSAPLMFGAWRTAVVFSIANAFALRTRIRCEEQALAGAESEGRQAQDPALPEPLR